MSSRSTSRNDENGQYTNITSRNGSPGANSAVGAIVLFPQPRILEPQSTSYRMDYPPGHDPRNLLPDPPNDFSFDRPSHIVATVAAVRQNALRQARNDAFLEEITATLRRAPHPLLHPVTANLDQFPAPEPTLLLPNLWHGHSSNISSVLSHAVPAAGSSNRTLPFSQYLLLQHQQSRMANLLGTRYRFAELDGRLQMSLASSFHLSSLQDYPLNNVAIAPTVENAAQIPGSFPIPTATPNTTSIPPARLPSQGRASPAIPLSLPVCLARPCDTNKLTDFQCLLRQQIEAFVATNADVETHRRGRNKPILQGQVGIRCRHCAHWPVLRRYKGAAYFPSRKYGIYQAAQNMATAHFTICPEVSLIVKEALINLKATSSVGAGRRYWSRSAAQLGLVDTEDRGIRFVRDLPEEDV